MIPADPYAGLGPAAVVRGDALTLPLPDASVDLVVTSPPYFALRSYQDGGQHYDGQIGSEATPDAFVSTLLDATRECVRVLKPSGSMWVNLGDKYSQRPGQYPSGNAGAGEGLVGGARSEKHIDARRCGAYTAMQPKSLIGVPWRYALRCIDELGLILRAEVIWSKPNGLPESVTDRVRRSHEQWFHFTVSPRYFAAVDEIREPYGEGTAARYAAGYKANKRSQAGQQSSPSIPIGVDDLTQNPLGKLPGSVWEIATEPLTVPAELGVDHFAAFPSEWPRRIISGWCPAGVCTACGEGRRPANRRSLRDLAEPDGNQRGMNAPIRERGRSEATITGYACACPDTTAPTTPGIVLDPFGGTGTTAMVARALGRHGISIDLSHDYCRLARWRVQDMDELASVRGMPRQGRKADDAQVSLLDMLDGEVAS